MASSRAAALDFDLRNVNQAIGPNRSFGADRTPIIDDAGFLGSAMGFTAISSLREALYANLRIYSNFCRVHTSEVQRVTALSKRRRA